MAQENQEIDLREWMLRILKNWYWFVIGCIIAGGLGVWHYFSTTYKFTVDSEIVLRENDAASMLPQADLMNMLGFGGGKAIADEMLVMNSRDMMRQVIDGLGLQTEYRKKEGLRWLGQYPAVSPMFISGIPVNAQISPANASSVSTFSRPLYV